MDPHVLHNLSYGMFIISSKKENACNGQIANTVFQVTSEPVTIAISLNKQNLTCEFIEDSRIFSVSILSEDTPLKFIGAFGFKSGRQINKFQDVGHTILPSGCPVVLDHSLGYLDAAVINRFDCGTHIVFLGKVRDMAMVKAGTPMTYEYYHQVKRGTTPAAAPTFIKDEK